MKNILNLEGVKVLNKEAQSTLTGGQTDPCCVGGPMQFLCPHVRCG